MLTGDVQQLPDAPARVFLARLRWLPGVALPDHTFTGPVGILGESGTLTISRPSGTSGELQAGKGIVIPSDVVTGEANAGPAPATLLMLGVVATTQGPLVPVPTPTLPPTVTPVPTAMSVPTASPTETPTPALRATNTPAPTPAAQGGAGTVLYQADANNGGLDKWPATGAWKHLNGMLVNDGTENTTIAPPFDTGTLNDYAVEAEIQVIRPGTGGDCSTFGIIARGSKNGSYSGNVDLTCYQRALIYNGNVLAENDNFQPGTNWHTYRLEVSGDSIRFLVDGSPLVETSDNRFLIGSGVGIFSQYVQLNVRSFKVIALGSSSTGATGQPTAPPATAGATGATEAVLPTH